MAVTVEDARDLGHAVEAPPDPPNPLRAAVEALPPFTVFRIDHGSHYMRTHKGIRYVGPARDDWEAVTLRQETDRAAVRRGTLTIVSSPPVEPS